MYGVSFLAVSLDHELLQRTSLFKEHVIQQLDKLRSSLLPSWRTNDESGTYELLVNVYLEVMQFAGFIGSLNFGN